MKLTGNFRVSCTVIIACFLVFGSGPIYCQNNRLLTNYLPASMQALAYFIDQLQYEPLSTVTAEPPFNAMQSTSETPIKRPTTTTTAAATTRPVTTNVLTNGASSWWQPPSWWQQSSIMPTTTTTTTKAPPTPAHRPGIFAPSQSPHLTHRFLHTNKKALEGYEIFCQMDATSTETLAHLPLALIRDIRSEAEHDEFTNDVESLDNFLRLYDDNYGREAFANVDAVLDRWSSTSTAGKKRVPPTKPYVEFLLVYDLLKRDAKAENLSKYEGYSEEMLTELHALSSASAPRQLYTLFKRMLERRDIQRSDVVSRIQGLIKELGNPSSATSKALQNIPALQFLP